MKYSSTYLKAFTLIELLIVIVIIGILATSLIPRVKGIQDKARYTRVEKDFQDFKTAVFMAQSNTGKPLKDITNNGYTAGACTTGSPSYMPLPDMRNLDYNHLCRVRWRQALRKIEEAAGLQTGALAGLETDPWGSPYLLDENEGENGGGNLCRADEIRSIGPNGARGDSDDRISFIAPIGCPGAY